MSITAVTHLQQLKFNLLLKPKASVGVSQHFLMWRLINVAQQDGEK